MSGKKKQFELIYCCYNVGWLYEGIWNNFLTSAKNNYGP